MQNNYIYFKINDVVYGYNRLQIIPFVQSLEFKNNEIFYFAPSQYYCDTDEIMVDNFIANSRTQFGIYCDYYKNLDNIPSDIKCIIVKDCDHFLPIYQELFKNLIKNYHKNFQFIIETSISISASDSVIISLLSDPDLKDKFRYIFKDGTGKYLY